MRHYDVLTVTDCRLPGGTAASVAEEITAQAAGGYRTGLLHVDSSLVATTTAFEPRIQRCLEDGLADLVTGPRPVDADLVVFRHPTVAGEVGERQPRVRTEQALLVANQAPGDVSGPAVHYDPRTVDGHLADWLDGVRPTWTPIGPLVRHALGRTAPDLPLTPDDWVNVIDVDRWHLERPGPLHRIPIVGRHSRNAAGKWPGTAAELLAVYPAAEDLEVHVLGGADAPRALLGGRLPPNWVVHEFGAISPQRFLGTVDVYVYYHHATLVEAFGRAILEAMASGLPTVLPPHFRDLFGDACHYAPASEAVGEVRRLAADRDHYRERSEAATAWARANAGHERHRERLGRLVAPSGHAGGRVHEAGTRTTTARPRVLFVSSNGAGVGHLMRLMAIARRLRDDVEPVFLTLSQAAQVVDDLGLFVEYLPSRGYTRGAYGAWHDHLRARLVELIDRYDAKAMLFDGTMPYWGFFDAGDERPAVQLWWSRRAMWKEGVTNVVVEHFSDRFDLILEPGELADDDRGITLGRRDETTVVAPITLLRTDELLAPETARKELGLDPDRVTVLVNLGAGNINDTSSQLGMVVDRLARQHELQVCVTRSIIAAQDRRLPDNVRAISVYPLARYLAAFDVAFAAAGYNSFHELAMAAVPTVWVPNEETSVDDQGARSAFAARAGIGLELREVTADTLDRAVRTVLDPEVRRDMHERALRLRTDDGAATAADVLLRALATPPAPRPTHKQLVERRESVEAGAMAGAPGTGRSAPADPSRPPAPIVEEAADETVVGEPATGPVAAAPDVADGRAPVGVTPAGVAPAGVAPVGVAPVGPAAPRSHHPLRPRSVAEAMTTIGMLTSRSVTRTAEGTRWTGAGRRSHTRRSGGARRGARRRGAARRGLATVTAELQVLATLVAGAPTLRRVGGRVFHLLPADVRRQVRRRLARWETAAGHRGMRLGRARALRLDVRPGNLLPPGEARRLASVAIVLPTGLTVEQHARIVDVIGQMQRSLRTFAPLVVTSCLDFRPLRDLDYLFEYQPDAERHARVPITQAWEQVRRQRLQDVLGRYRVGSVIVLPPPAGDALADAEPLAADLRLALAAYRA